MLETATATGRGGSSGPEPQLKVLEPASDSAPYYDWRQYTSTDGPSGSVRFRNRSEAASLADAKRDFQP